MGFPTCISLPWVMSRPELHFFPLRITMTDNLLSPLLLKAQTWRFNAFTGSPSFEEARNELMNKA